MKLQFLRDRSFRFSEGVFVVNDTFTGDNQIAATFYDGPHWPKVRAWDAIFWLLNGGEKKARKTVLQHLHAPGRPALRLLDVAIGDGRYIGDLPASWEIVGVDISETQLEECRFRNADRNLPLFRAEAEALPFADRQFDAVLSNGGFNHFNDPEKALREMVRVAKPGAPIVIADEMPDFLKFGHSIGWPALDRWIGAKIMGMGDDFSDLVERHRDLDVAAIGRRVLEDSQYEVIWKGLGYKMVGYAPKGGAL